jgi:tRNA pseudouridine38-40 synthase
VQVSLARAARTDAGVHAAINVISLKMILNPPSMAEGTALEDHLNSFLPSTMRVWSVIRVQGAFDPRRLCDQRQYEYTLPTHVFLGPKPGSPMAETLDKLRATSRSSSSVPPSTSTSDAPAAPTPVVPAVAATKAFWDGQGSSKFGADVEAKKKWRMPADLLEETRKFVKEYEGSHNYYNFTVQKDFRDRSCQRVMKKLEVRRFPLSFFECRRC